MENAGKEKKQLKISGPASPVAGRPADIYIVKGPTTDLICPTLFNGMAARQIIFTSLSIKVSLRQRFMAHDGKKQQKNFHYDHFQLQ